MPLYSFGCFAIRVCRHTCRYLFYYYASKRLKTVVESSIFRLFRCFFRIFIWWVYLAFGKALFQSIYCRFLIFHRNHSGYWKGLQIPKIFVRQAINLNCSKTVFPIAPQYQSSGLAYDQLVSWNFWIISLWTVPWSIRYAALRVAKINEEMPTEVETMKKDLLFQNNCWYLGLPTFPWRAEVCSNLKHICSCLSLTASSAPGQLKRTQRLID